MKNNHWLGVVLKFAAPCKGKLIVSTIFQIISVAAGLVPYIGVYKIISLFFEGIATSQEIFFWAGVCLSGYVIMLFLHGISTTLSHISAYTILEGLRKQMAKKIMRVPLGNVINQPIGNLKNQIVDKVETIERPIAHLIPEMLPTILLPLCIFIYIISIDWRMALAALITIPIALVSYTFVLRTFNQKYDAYMQANNYVNSVIVEYVEGIQVIKAFNQSASSYEKFENAVKMFLEYTLDWYRNTWKPMNFGAAVLPSTLLGTLPVGLLLFVKGTLQPAELVICIILSLGMITPLTTFTVYTNELKSIQYAVVGAESLLQMQELSNATQPIELKDYSIDLKKVSFSYDGTEKKVLENLNLTIPEGSFTALVGPSGGGKSTIARLIARFWDINTGSISIGGTDIRNIPLDQLSDMVSFVTQDNFLFDCSILENIRLGNPEADDDEVYAASKAACCDEFIVNLERGYDTTAGEAGGHLSGGERQRIAIARAILKNAPIVILDEATAFTDPQNEDKIQRSIAALTKGKTLLVIAHRLSTIKNADQIVVLNQGRAEAIGTHQTLLEKCPLYKKMWNAHINAKEWAVNKEV